MFFVFSLLGAAGASIGSVVKGKGVKPEDVRPTPCHPFFAALALIVAVVSVAWMIANGLSNALLTFDIVSISVFLGIGMVIPAPRHRPNLRDIAKPEDINPRTGSQAAELRTQAATIATAPPEPETAAKPVPAPRIASLNELRAEADEMTRLRRVAAVLLTPCKDCGAGKAELCTFVQDAATTLMDAERNIVAHDHRIGAAVKSKLLPVTEMVVQFEGHVPDEVWKAAL